MNPYEARGLGRSAVASQFITRQLEFQAEMNFRSLWYSAGLDYDMRRGGYLPYYPERSMSPTCAYCGVGFIVGGASCGCGANRSS